MTDDLPPILELVVQTLLSVIATVAGLAIFWLLLV